MSRSKFIILSFCFFLTLNLSAQKTYQKNYFDNGALKEEGWMKNGKKTDYWKFYYENGTIKKEGHFSKNKSSKYWYFYAYNGNKKSEGHFANGEKNNWWLFYDSKGNINHKCQLKHNQKNGYCLMYNKGKMVSVSKFKAGKKIKEWTNIESFKKENKLSDLQQ